LNILLDTHIALWAIDDSPRLPAQARELIANPKHAIWTSVASLWEIAIKHSRNSDDMPIGSADALKYFQLSGYRILPIQAEHTLMVETLPHHHKDPFDRILIAQALAEPMRLLTHDALVAKYSDSFILV